MGIQGKSLPVRPHGVPKAKVKQDEAIIGTNDHSIVSKRSVEKLYLKDEPEFLRAFVHKFKRRTPLINRGYWLRTKAIEAVVRRFLDEDSGKSKAIVNLGCGYEPLPFRMMWKRPMQCQNVKFIDLDFPQLIAKKIEIINNEPIFADYIQLSKSPVPQTLNRLDTENYCAIGCDLGDREQVRSILNSHLGLNNRSILFIGEVSIIYMPPHEATALIHICGTFSDARFCLLENHLPVGHSHPFARTMIEHYRQTPLRGLAAFSTMNEQKNRFQSAGWDSVQATDLWSLWQNDDFIADEERTSLERVEPFDEWEGFALWAGHHLLLLATTLDAQDTANSWISLFMPVTRLGPTDQVKKIAFCATEIPRGYGRVNGSVLVHSSKSFLHCGGTVNSARQGLSDRYGVSHCSGSNCHPTPPPLPLNCHTITAMGNERFLLIGGRTSPLRASSACYLFENRAWSQVADLHPARYRHGSASVTVDGQPGVLVFGGRTSTGEVLDQWCLFLNRQWHTLLVTGDQPPSLFGMIVTTTGLNSGVLIGGLQSNGRLELRDRGCGYWCWSLESTATSLLQVQVTFVPVDATSDSAAKSIQRFGAEAVSTPSGILLVGGIGPNGPLQRQEELIILNRDCSVQAYESVLNDKQILPMFIGHSVAKVSDQEIIMVGGGMVCYSFGVFWNDSVYCISFNDTHMDSERRWRVLSDKPLNDDFSTEVMRQTKTRSQDVSSTVRGAQIPRVKNGSEVTKRLERNAALPIVMENTELGPCTTLWTKEYLKEKVGLDRPTIIHSAMSCHLSFRDKNFTYHTVPFGSFIENATKGAHVYMRALSTTNPSKAPANLITDYPALSADFHVPPELRFAQDYQHSSVLRISGDVIMWLHYDVMSNILCQVTGSKRIILFPPKDVSHLAFPAGETTSNIDVFAADAAERLKDCSPVETILAPGEVLFIPACWPHATAPAPVSADTKASKLSVAVNVFFRSFDDALYAAGRDVYGNRDLEMYQNGRKHVAKVLSLLSSTAPEEASSVIARLTGRLRAKERVADDVPGGKEVNRIIASTRDVPEDIASFYLARLADELLEGIKQQ